MYHLKRIFWVALVFVAVLTRASAEESPVDAVSRRFRMVTYQQYRSDRAEYDRRISAAEQVVGDWRQHGKPADRIADIVRWFETAHRSRRLPIVPNYGKTAETTEHREAIHHPNRDPAPPQEKPEPKAKVVHENVSQPKPTDTGPEANPKLPPTVTARKPLLSSDFISPPIKPPSERVARRAVLPPKRRSAPFSEIRIREPEPTVSLANPKRSTIEPPRDDVLFGQQPTIEVNRPPFDLEVLTAKIRSLNLSLTQIENDLNIDRDWKLDDLEAATNQLAKLLSEYDLVMTYYNVTPSKFQSQLMVPLEPTTSVALLAQRLFELKIRLANDVSLNSEQLVRLNRAYDRMQEMSPPPRGRQQ